jgi:hypothetical protein
LKFPKTNPLQVVQEFQIGGTSGVNLTFASHRAEVSQGECQIQSSTSIQYCSNGPLIPTFAEELRRNGMRMLELDH